MQLFNEKLRLQPNSIRYEIILRLYFRFVEP
ncbi:MAG: hypothetical protein RL511_938, partial [Bacteroidota bacterium]